MQYTRLLPLFLCWIVAPVATSRAADDGRTVSLADIQSGNVSIIGRLGRPIGTVVEITGEWIGPEPLSELTKIGPELKFRVVAIDGDPLKEPFEFLERDVHIIPGSAISEEVGQRLTVYAFESCHYWGVPASAWGGDGSPVATDRPFGLYSRLQLVRPVDRTDRQGKGREVGESKTGVTEPRVDQQRTRPMQSIAVGMELQQALAVLKRNMVNVKKEDFGDVRMSEEDGWLQYVAKPGYESEDALVLLAKEDRRTGSHKIESMYWHIKYDEDYKLPKLYRALRYLHLQSIDVRAFLRNEHSSETGRHLDDNPFE